MDVQAAVTDDIDIMINEGVPESQVQQIEAETEAMGINDPNPDNCCAVAMDIQPTILDDTVNEGTTSSVNDIENDITSAVLKAFCMIEDMGLVIY